MKLENNYHIPNLVQAFEWYRCYYLYSAVCQQIWCNVLPLFFPRYTGVKKTQHYKLFISDPIVLFWRTKKNQLSEFSINGTTEKQHIADLVQTFSQENGGFW
jgi:hypothetical protein